MVGTLRELVQLRSDRKAISQAVEEKITVEERLIEYSGPAHTSFFFVRAFLDNTFRVP